jgi:hypothetical protein
MKTFIRNKENDDFIKAYHDPKDIVDMNQIKVVKVISVRTGNVECEYNYVKRSVSFYDDDVNSEIHATYWVDVE